MKFPFGVKSAVESKFILPSRFPLSWKTLRALQFKICYPFLLFAYMFFIANELD